MVGNRARALIIRSRQITGLSPEVIAELVAVVGPLWLERHQAVLASRARRRAVGAGAKHRLVFVDRLLATVVQLRHGATHDVLPAGSVPTGPPSRVRSVRCGRCSPNEAAPSRPASSSLAEAIDHLGASGQTRIIDGTENRFRRPAAGRRLAPKAVREADLRVIEAVASLRPQPGGCDLRTVGEQRSDRP
ncbi:hypothetical protein [Streptomyces sp. NPDC056169]|uniref:hypothetical protein n=1 Tax=Streptomyces sp. NPDC056169 TaxID=3345734 RepID=UPI0035D69EC0